MDGEKTVLVPITHGSEEIESMSIVGTFKRAQANVILAKVFTKEETDNQDLLVNMSRGVKITADHAITEDTLNQAFDAIVLPGGLKGAENFANSEVLVSLLKQHDKQGKLLAGICATPAFVFEPNGILEGKDAT